MENKIETPTKGYKNLYQEVTDTIIEQLEQGTVPWHQPWYGEEQVLLDIPKNPTTGDNYKGINILLLWSSVLKNSYETSEWATLRQWNNKKESIRKGEKGSTIVYYDTFEKEIDGEIQKVPFLVSSKVFNRSQLVNYTGVKSEVQQPERSLVETIDHVEDFVKNTQALVIHFGKRAFYKPSTDKITMPLPEYFLQTPNCSASEGYYSVLLHELAHWSGNEKRLNRLKGKKYGDQNYANEELVAEFSSAFLCAGFGIKTAEKGNHAAYIDSWLKALRDDNKCLFRAASEARKAVDYLNMLQPN